MISCKSVDKTNNQLNTRYKFKRFLHGVFFFFRSHELSYLTKALKTAYIVSWNGSTKYTSRIVLKNLLAMIHVNIVIERKPLTMPIFKHVYEFSPCALKISERRAWSVEMIVWDTEIFWIPKHNNHLKNIYKLLWKFLYFLLEFKQISIICNLHGSITF